MDWRKHIAACSLGLLIAGSGKAAASEIIGRVERIDVRASDGLHVVTIQGTSSARPACAQRYSYYMIKDEKSDVGKAQLAMVLSAYMAGKPVKLVGAGTCVRWPDGEDIESVTLN